MLEPTKLTPSDLLPKYITEGLKNQARETLRAVANYAQELRMYRAAQTEADRTAVADTHDIKRATADELTTKTRKREFPKMSWIRTRYSKKLLLRNHRP